MERRFENFINISYQKKLSENYSAEYVGMADGIRDSRVVRSLSITRFRASRNKRRHFIYAITTMLHRVTS